ncbi:MAG: non-heme iron oxygenase ferredoxin subunit [Rhodobacterales bacterium]|nr:non-heme iron oxygenase ferredoxin subunit [Rhodobacterales bacterium]
MTVTTTLDPIGTEDIAPGEAVQVQAAGLTLAVFRVGDEFYVTDDQCTHGPGLLHEGCLTGYEIECDFHQGSFNIRTGEVIEPPCTVALRVYPVTLRDGRVMIDLPA